MYYDPSRCFASLASERDREILAVLERVHVCLFDIVVAKHARNQGLGIQLVSHLLHWGQVHGGKRAYLQVMCDNRPALRLYARLGFRERYRYWYRVRTVDDGVARDRSN